jgi:two-component system response regulator PrrA
MRTVLVVDDNACIRAAVAESLALEGYEAALARDGDEALRCVDRLRPWAVVTDFDMPHMDGGRLVVELRLRMPDLPAVIMTGNPDARPLINWLRAEYLAKPFGLDELLQAIGAATRVRHSTDRTERL